MHEDIIWQREIKCSNELDNIDQLENTEHPSIYFYFQNERSNKNNNNSTSENSVSIFKLSDLCCNLNIYLRKLIGRDKPLEENCDITNRNNNNNFINQPRCECWTVEDYFDQKIHHQPDYIHNKKLIKLDEKEKNDLLNLDIKESDEIKRNSQSSISTHCSLSKIDSKMEITYFKRRPSKFSIALNKNEDNALEESESNFETDRSLADEDFLIEAFNELGIKLSQVSTCFDSFDSQFKNIKNLN